MRLAALLLCLPTALSAQAKVSARRVDTVTVIVHDTVYGFPANALGLTFCDTRGQVRSFADVAIGADTLARIIKHEAVHRVQSATYPSCRAWDDAAAHNVYLAAEWEAQAYCVEVVAADTVDKRDLLVEDLNRVFKQFHGSVPMPVIDGLFKRYCAL